MKIITHFLGRMRRGALAKQRCAPVLLSCVRNAQFLSFSALLAPGLLSAASADCLPPPAGLVAWWPGEGNARDIIGTNRGTLNGGATAVAIGKVGSAFRFDGTNSYVQVPDSPTFHPPVFTIEAWLRFNLLNTPGSGPGLGEQFIIFKQNSRSTNFEGFYLGKTRNSGRHLLTLQVTSADGQNITVDSATVVTNGVWYHVAGVRDTNSLSIYVNGRLENQAAVGFPQDYGTLPLYFGSSGQPSWDRKFKGVLDEVSLYDRPLASNEIAAIYSAGAAGKCQVPRIIAQPQSQSVVAGTTLALSVVATGKSPMVYQWRRNGQNLTDGANLSGAASPTLTLSGTQTNNAGNYRVIVTNPAGAITSAVAVVTVSSAPTAPTILTQPTNQSVFAGANVSFAVLASGTSPLTYQWLLNNTNLADGGQFTGSGTATLRLTNAQPTNSGGYSVVITNFAGAVTSSVAALSVLPRNGCITLPSGLIGWWPGYGNGEDIIGTNNAILLGGAVDGAPGKVGTAFHFDGTNGYAQIPNAPELNPKNVTVECWVRFDRLDSDGTNPQGNAYLVFKQNTRSSVFEGINLAKHRVAGGDIIVWEVSSAAGQAVQINSVTFVTTNVWYHVAGVRGTNYTQLYLNGQLEAQGVVDFPQDYGNYPLYFGTSGEPYWDRRLAGSLDEVSLYKRALSGGEIAAIYQAGAAGKCEAHPTFLTAPGVSSPGSTATSAPIIVQARMANVSSGTSASPTSAFKLVFSGVTGQTYGIQSCIDISLGQWRGLTNLVLQEPVGSWTDPRPMTQPKRFYRVLLGPVSVP